MTIRSWIVRIAEALLLSAAVPASAATIYGVVGVSPPTLVSFDSAAPGTYLSSVAITGLNVGEDVLALDFRLATGDLVLLGSASRVYRVDRQTGAATPIGAAFQFTLSGTSFGFDFNPTVDRIRVVSDTEQNLRLNPSTGALAAADGMLSYVIGDPHDGQNPTVVAAAYLNNYAGATVTALFGIDSGFDKLVFLGTPNTGLLQTVGPLNVDVVDTASFDILSVGNTDEAYAALSQDGATSALYSINLNTGAATLIGGIGPASLLVRGMAVRPLRLLRSGFE